MGCSRISLKNYEHFQRSSNNSDGIRKNTNNLVELRTSPGTPQTFEEPRTAPKTHKTKETPDAIQGTVTNHEEPRRNPPSREELMIKYVALRIHTGCLRRNLEGCPVGLLIVGKATSSVLYLRVLGTDLCAWNAKERYFERKYAAELARAFGAGHHTRTRKDSGRSDARHAELWLRLGRDLAVSSKRYQYSINVASPGVLAVFARSVAAEGRREAPALKVSL